MSPLLLSAVAATNLLQSAFQPFVDRGELPGVIAVLCDGAREDIACVGYADVEKKRPIAMDQAFQQCSQTKGFCGVTVAKLIEEGKLGLDDPVSKYLPEFADLRVYTNPDEKAPTNGLVKAQKVLTLRMCLNHTGGFRFELKNYWQMGGWSRKMPLRSVAATAAAAPLLFEPGTRGKYLNTGIDVAAAVVETVVGKDWATYLQETVLDPLEMRDTTFWPSDETVSRKMELCICEKGKKARWLGTEGSMQPPFNGSGVFASAGAGLWTTARDQLKFYSMLMNLGVGENGVRILKEETVRTLLAVSSRPPALGLDGYSLGLFAPKAGKDGMDAWFGHGGAYQTNCMVNWRRKELKLWVVQLGGSPRPWEPAIETAAERFFNRHVDDSGVKAYTGRTR
mgnify:CR=1 FL=1